MNTNTVAGGKLPVIDLRKTGENITRMRKESGVTVRELQMILGFTNPQAIYNWQNGVSLPTVDNLIILASVLGVTIDELLVIEDDTDDEQSGSDICHIKSINTFRLS